MKRLREMGVYFKNRIDVATTPWEEFMEMLRDLNPDLIKEAMDIRKKCKNGVSQICHKFYTNCNNA